MTAIKICGLTTPEAVQCCNELAVDFSGFVCYPASPRHLEPGAYRTLTRQMDKRNATVLVTANEDSAVLEEYFGIYLPTYLQCHGQEHPEQLNRLRERFGVGIIKSFPISDEADLAPVGEYAETADILLIDAKPQPGQLPGGNAVPFNWSILDGFDFPLPWMLSGGLNAANVKRAIALTHAPIIDVSSGVESTRGTKNPNLIKQFVNHVRKLDQAA